MKFENKQQGKGGYFLAQEGDRNVGEMSYVFAGDNLFIIDHTHVIPEYANQGIGKKLVNESVKFAREKGYKIMATCSFAKAIFMKHPEYRDVYQG